MNDPIGAVKKLGRVSLDCRRRQMLSFSLFRSLLFPLFHAFPCVHVTNIVFYYSILFGDVFSFICYRVQETL